MQRPRIRVFLCHYLLSYTVCRPVDIPALGILRLRPFCAYDQVPHQRCHSGPSRQSDDTGVSNVPGMIYDSFLPHARFMYKIATGDG